MTPPIKRPVMPPRMVAVTYHAIPLTIFWSATLLVSDAAMAEVRNGMNKPWQNLNDIKVPKLIVRAQPISHIIISTLANAAKGRMEYFSLRNPEGILPKVIPAKTIETDSEE